MVAFGWRGHGLVVSQPCWLVRGGAAAVTHRASWAMGFTQPLRQFRVALLRTLKILHFMEAAVSICNLTRKNFFKLNDVTRLPSNYQVIFLTGLHTNLVEPQLYF